MSAPRFPIDDVLPELLASLAVHPRLVLEAPPGAGKTTQVPLALLAAPWCSGRVLMLEPRRIAARAAAGFMAARLHEAVGDTVGYRIRFETRVSASTRVEIVTEGILTRLVQDDPTLDGISAVLFDEFHERHLASDLGLAFCLDVQASLRPDLRVVVMSATLDGERIARFLDAPRVSSPGRSHPVTIEFLAQRPRETAELQFKRAVQRALAETAGDVLCFLPGKREIERARRLLTDLAQGDTRLETLHGELAVAEQARILAPHGGRQIVLATNVAESSVTLPNVRAVVDSGLAREPRFDAASGMSRLETVAIAQSSATQRAGRAGRVAPGTCYRLWPESQRLDTMTRPEIQRVDLAAYVLEIRSWGSDALRLPDPPPPGALAQAETLLIALGALDAQARITAHGKALLALGVHPRLASAMLRAPAALRGLACDLAALLDARDPLRGELARSDDLRPRLSALAAWRRDRVARDGCDRGALVAIEQAATQWRRRLSVAHEADAVDSHDAGDVLALAYPDRIALRDAKDSRRYQLANGRGATLAPDSTLIGEPWLAVAELRYDERDSLIRRAAPLDPRVLETLHPERFVTARELRFNPATRAVETTLVRRYAALVLEHRMTATARNDETAALLLQGIRDLGLACLPWSGDLREWQTRVSCLRIWCPELGLPDLGDETLLAQADEWLAPLVAGGVRVADIEAGALANALHERLDHRQRRALDDYAPVALTVPSGMSRRLQYSPGAPPVLAVKLQEMFGLADTPRIARGRIPVLLHLLSPRQIPIQVTQDLRGFWERTYPDVRKELKGRYPKHPWPDDPWTATATHRAKPRGT